MVNVNIEPLGQDNYGTWSFSMKMLFRYKKLWNVVMTPPPPTELESDDNVEALSLIGLHVKSNHFWIIDSCVTANEAWLRLKTMYQGQKDVEAQHPRQQMPRFKKAGYESLTSYFKRALRVVENLTSSGVAVDKVELAYKVLDGLPPEYDVAVIALRVTGHQNTLEVLLPRLLPIEAGRSANT